MSRYRLMPTPAQRVILLVYCAHARNAREPAVEQYQRWRRGRKSAPGYREQCRQLTQARAEHPWLAAGSQTVQQQALRDFTRAIAAFFDPANPARRPTWRKAGRDDVNAAINIAAGHAVNARGGLRDTGPVNREPHLLLQLV